MLTQKEKDHRANLKRFGCVLCFQIGYGEGIPAELHETSGGLIPLCSEHHHGELGIHTLGKNAFESMYEISEDDLLIITNEVINYKWETFDGAYLGIRLQ